MRQTKMRRASRAEGEPGRARLEGCEGRSRVRSVPRRGNQRPELPREPSGEVRAAGADLPNPVTALRDANGLDRFRPGERTAMAT